MCEDILDRYFDDEFFRDMVKDFEKVNLQTYLDNYIQSLIVFVFNATKVESNFKRMKEEDFKKLYNCQKISYKKPIKYKDFKEISAETIPLIRLNLLLAELAVYTQTIKDAYNIPLSLFASFNVNDFIMYILTLQLSDVLDYGTRQETIDYFRDNVEYYRMFEKVKSSMNDYWLWLFVYDFLKQTCLLPLRNMAKLSKKFAWEAFKISENKPCIYEDDEKALKEQEEALKQSKKEKRTAHNAYTGEETLIIYKAKKTYKTVINMYKLSKFIANALNEKLNYKQTINKLEKLSLDEEYSVFRFAIEQVYNCSKNCDKCEYKKSNNCQNIKEKGLLTNLKAFAKEHLSVIYNTLFNDKKSIKEIASKINSTKKQDFAFEIIKDLYPFFADKTNKTISNIFSSDIVLNDEQEYYQQFKENYYEKQQEQNNDTEIMITALNNIGDAFELYIKEPTQERKVFLMMNLKQVQMSLNF